MRAIAYQEYGGPDRLHVTELPKPKCGPDTVVVRARTAAVNPVDVAAREGYLDGIMDVHFPVVPGWDVAGVVEVTGPAVTEYEPGDQVIGYVRRDDLGQGTFAELVPAPIRALAPKPHAASWSEAAGLPLVGLTAYQVLLASGASAGDIVLVHAAAGGVGHLAVQLGRIFGARVIGTASPRNHDFLRELGAEPVAYGDGLVEAVRALAPGGVDAALDCVGGDALDASYELVREASGVVSIIDPDVRDKGGRYVYVRPNAEQLTLLAEWVDVGRLRVVVEETFPLSDTGAAHELVTAGHVRGKVVVEIP